MTNAEMPKVYEDRNVRRFREMPGIKQEALAADLGDEQAIHNIQNYCYNAVVNASPSINYKCLQSTEQMGKRNSIELEFSQRLLQTEKEKIAFRKKCLPVKKIDKKHQ